MLKIEKFGQLMFEVNFDSEIDKALIQLNHNVTAKLQLDFDPTRYVFFGSGPGMKPAFHRTICDGRFQSDAR